MSEPNPVGRPPLYTIELAEQICERLVYGESLAKICLEESMPSFTTVMKWCREIPEFTHMYALTRDMQADYQFEEMLVIADDGSRDYKVETDDNGGARYAVDHDHISRSKLRVDTRKWQVARLSPRKYGDKLVQQSQQLDANGVPVDPTPTVVVAPSLADFYRTVKRIPVDGDDKI